MTNHIISIIQLRAPTMEVALPLKGKGLRGVETRRVVVKHIFYTIDQSTSDLNYTDKQFVSDVVKRRI